MVFLFSVWYLPLLSLLEASQVEVDRRTSVNQARAAVFYHILLPFVLQFFFLLEMGRGGRATGRGAWRKGYSKERVEIRFDWTDR